MSPSKGRHDSSSFLRKTLKRGAFKAAQITFQTAQTALHRFDGEARGLRRTSQKIAGRLVSAGELLINKSPIYVPAMLQDTIGRMQQGLSQLGNSIESMNAGLSGMVSPATAQATPQRATKSAERRPPSVSTKGVVPTDERAHQGTVVPLPQATPSKQGPRKHADS